MEMTDYTPITAWPLAFRTRCTSSSSTGLATVALANGALANGAPVNAGPVVNGVDTTGLSVAAATLLVADQADRGWDGRDARQVAGATTAFGTHKSIRPGPPPRGRHR